MGKVKNIGAKSTEMVNKTLDYRRTVTQKKGSNPRKSKGGGTEKKKIQNVREDSCRNQGKTCTSDEEMKKLRGGRKKGEKKVQPEFPRTRKG